MVRVYETVISDSIVNNFVCSMLGTKKFKNFFNANPTFWAYFKMPVNGWKMHYLFQILKVDWKKCKKSVEIWGLYHI
jgi:hypothetical protein